MPATDRRIMRKKLSLRWHLHDNGPTLLLPPRRRRHCCAPRMCACNLAVVIELDPPHLIFDKRTHKKLFYQIHLPMHTGTKFILPMHSGTKSFYVSDEKGPLHSTSWVPRWFKATKWLDSARNYKDKLLCECMPKSERTKT